MLFKNKILDFNRLFSICDSRKKNLFLKFINTLGRTQFLRGGIYSLLLYSSLINLFHSVTIQVIIKFVFLEAPGCQGKNKMRDEVSRATKHNGITIRKKVYSLLRHFWTIPENTFPNNVSPSSSMVFDISAVVLTTSSYFVSSLFNPSSKAPFFTGTTVAIYPGFLFLVSKASCQYRVSLCSLLYRYIFFCMEKTMLQIPICFWFLVSNIKSDLLAILDFCRLNWKS